MKSRKTFPLPAVAASPRPQVADQFRRGWRQIMSIAACLALLAAVAGVLPGQQRTTPVPSVASNHAPAGSTLNGTSTIRPTPSTSTQRVIFVDLSDSPGSGDAARWLDAARRKVFEQTQFGDSVIVYGIHDHTAESGPIFDASVPMLPSGASMAQTIAARKALRHARVDGSATLEEVLHAPARSHSTRLIESLRRIPKDPARATEVLYLSDMLESTRELDLEHTRITRQNLPSLAQAAIDRYHLTQGALDGVTVYCVLDSPSLGGPGKANGREALDSFWRLIVTSLGGNLASFDSRVQ